MIPQIIILADLNGRLLDLIKVKKKILKIGMSLNVLFKSSLITDIHFK
jgi:hypothetical protein